MAARALRLVLKVTDRCASFLPEPVHRALSQAVIKLVFRLHGDL